MTDNIINKKFDKDDFKNGKKISVLRRKISHLRFFIYVFVAASVLMTSVALLWIYSTFSQPAFETYFSKPTSPTRALLYLSYRTGHYKVGDEFSVDILVNTKGNFVNVVAAYLIYSASKMEAVSIDTSDSVFDMIAEKKILEKEGKIKLTIGKPTPGVNVYNGKVGTIRFKAIEKSNPFVDNIYFDFREGSPDYSAVFLDDKIGTNILEDVRGAKIFID